ncbi:MAG TPA: helix-turn-helix transcriptional regulator [Burkholderiales bacterium]|nr:helix-turn-helix transcriptional regulator [Burkholderiales bacterium]
MKPPMNVKRAPKRNLFAELNEGMTALAQVRQGKHSGIVRGSGNIYRNFDVPDADIRQLKAILVAEIIKTLDKKGLTVRKAQSLTGIDAGDFSRVRNADFRRISVERLMAMINGLGSRVDVAVALRRAEPRHAAAVA